MDDVSPLDKKEIRKLLVKTRIEMLRNINRAIQSVGKKKKRRSKKRVRR